MPISVTLTKRQDREWFTSLDDIYGTVVFTNRRCVGVGRIVVYLEGILKTSIRPVNAGQDYAFGNNEHLLFRCQTDLFRSQSSTSARSWNTFGPGSHSFAFHFEVPLLTSCSSTRLASIQHTQSALPPSFALASDVLTASATYQLRAVVERPGLLKRRISVTQSIEFRPLQPPRISEQQRRLRITGHLNGEHLGVKSSIAVDGSELPPYTPSVTFEITSPSSRVVRPGDHVDLGMRVCVPAELRQSPDAIWLESLTIRLKTTTTANVASHTRSHIKHISICSVKGFLPLEPAAGSEIITVPSQLWESHVFPQISSSFKSCGIERTHRLEVGAGIVSSLTYSVQTIATGVDVVVESGVAASSGAPPDYIE